MLEAKGVIRAGTEMFVEGESAGFATSGAFAPTLGCSIGLARLDRVQGEAEAALRVPKIAGPNCQTPLRQE